MDRRSESTTAWAALAAPWRRCFELAWQAHQAGSLAVGAVVSDPVGTVVARRPQPVPRR